jgi:hypothetical protein
VYTAQITECYQLQYFNIYGWYDQSALPLKIPPCLAIRQQERIPYTATGPSLTFNQGFTDLPYENDRVCGTPVYVECQVALIQHMNGLKPQRLCAMLPRALTWVSQDFITIAHARTKLNLRNGCIYEKCYEPSYALPYLPRWSSILDRLRGQGPETLHTTIAGVQSS